MSLQKETTSLPIVIDSHFRRNQAVRRLKQEIHFLIIIHVALHSSADRVASA